jgi:hypothetical protein
MIEFKFKKTHGFRDNAEVYYTHAFMGCCAGYFQLGFVCFCVWRWEGLYLVQTVAGEIVEAISALLLIPYVQVELTARTTTDCARQGHRETNSAPEYLMTTLLGRIRRVSIARQSSTE